MKEFISPVLPIVAIVLGIICIISIVLKWYRKVPQDKAGVVTGQKKRVITGGGGFVIPVFERIDYISLGNIPLSVKTRNSLSSQGVPINVATTAVIKVKNEEASILTAIEQFVGRNEKEIIDNISETAVSVLEGKLREIIAGMTVEDLYNSREEFRSQVEQVVGVEFQGMGLEVKNFTITDITDDNGYIDAMGEGRIAERRRDSEVQKAEAKRDEDIKVAQAAREGEIARIEKEKAIAEAQKDKDIKVAEFKKETERARAEQEKSYDIQSNVSQKDVTQAELDVELLKQQRQKEITEAEIQVQIVAEQKNIELAEKKAEQKKAALRAEVIEPAEAQKEKTKADAEAKKIKDIAEAEAQAHAKKLQAQAEAEAMKIKAEAEADAIRLKGQAKAEAIKAEGLAEAEAMEKKAEAQAKMGKASIVEMVVGVLPQMAEAVAKPLEQIDKISIIGGSESNGVDQISSYVPTALAKTIESVKEATGFDLIDVMKAQTIEGVTDRNISLSGIPHSVNDGSVVKLKEQINEDLVDTEVNDLEITD